jgi:hypothetical protein
MADRGMSVRRIEGPRAYPSWTGEPPDRSGPGRSDAMPQYVLVLDAHAMDHIPDEDMPDVERPRTRSARRPSTGVRQRIGRPEGKRQWPPTGRSLTAHR